MQLLWQFLYVFIADIHTIHLQIFSQNVNYQINNNNNYNDGDDKKRVCTEYVTTNNWQIHVKKN